MPLGLFAILVSFGVAAETQTVRVEVAARAPPAGTRLFARTTWLGNDRSTELTDDGRTPGDRVGDGVYTAAWTGGEVRILPVTLVAVSRAGTETTLLSSNEVVDVDGDRLAYAVDWRGPTTRRVAAAASSRSMEVADSAMVAAALGWTGIVFAYVAWLVQRLPPPGPMGTPRR